MTPLTVGFPTYGPSNTPLEIVSVSLSDLINLPDPEAAEKLNERMGIFEQVRKIEARAYVERGLIIREFEKRKLWAYLIDHETGRPFPHLTAWLSCSDFLGCRRTNFEAKRDLTLLADVPPEKLIGVDKNNLKVLTQLSTAVRNQPDVLEAAKTLDNDQFVEKIESEHATQHIETRKTLRFNPGKSGHRAVEKTIAYALEHGIAGSRDEAIVMACEEALHQWELEEELGHEPEVSDGQECLQ